MLPAVPSVSVPPAYQGPTRGEAMLQVQGDTVRACLEAVEVKYPGFLAQIFDEQGDLHRFVKLFLNEEPVEQAQLGLTVTPDDEVAIVAAIGGG